MTLPEIIFDLVEIEKIIGHDEYDELIRHARQTSQASQASQDYIGNGKIRLIFTNMSKVDHPEFLIKLIIIDLKFSK